VRHIDGRRISRAAAPSRLGPDHVADLACGSISHMTERSDVSSAFGYGGLSSMASETLTDDAIYNRGLPITTRNLIGREDEIEELEQAWSSEQTRIMSIVAQGGAGKSALVNEWLRRMRDKDYLGASRVCAWSFYSQGTRENIVAADPFISAALTWLGDEPAISLNPRQRGLRLASLIKEHKLLLVLDGMDPLQYPLQAPHVGGQLTDDSVRALLHHHPGTADRSSPIPARQRRSTGCIYCCPNGPREPHRP
jgi:AAA ATPase domain